MKVKQAVIKNFETIASDGVAGFYNGWVADDMKN